MSCFGTEGEGRQQKGILGMKMHDKASAAFHQLAPMKAIR